jgi:hypothetical protein
MTDKKISELTALTGAALADTDLIPVVDTSATTTKKISLEELKIGLDTPSGFIRKTGGTFSGAIDVTGTVTADGLTVDGDINAHALELDGSPSAFGSTSSTAYILKTGSGGSAPFNQAGALVYQPRTTTTDGRSNHLFYTGDPLALRMNIQPTGDISFYEDTGTTAKFFWDASAESLGIGITAPVRPLHVQVANNGGSVSTAIFENSASLAGSQSEIILVSGGNTSRGASISSYNESATGQPASMLFSTSAAYATPTERMRIDSSGNVGIGTSSPIYTSATRTTTTINGTASANLSFGVNGTGYGNIYADSASFELGSTTNSNPVKFTIGGTERMRIDASGSVGIGVVPSTIWSSSYDALQIGLGGSMYAHAAAGSNMHMAANSVYEGTAPNYYDKYLTSSTASKYVQDSGLHIWSTAASGTAGDAITWSEAMRIDSSGNVGIGTSSPDTELHIEDATGNAVVQIESSAAGYSAVFLGDVNDGDVGQIRYDHSDNSMRFGTNATAERMRIDASGNVLVGKTATAFGTAGVEASAGSGVWSTRSGFPPASFNRLTNDGDIASFYKDGSTVGSIGVDGGRLYIGSDDTSIFFDSGATPFIKTARPCCP